MKMSTPACFMTAIFAFSVSSLFAADGPDPNIAAEHAYLGVVVAPAHPTLAANLKGLLSPEQGLTVEEVAENSAAMKADIKVHDVLTAYDNQKLFSMDQFVKLVRSDPPGREVRLDYLRDGKLEKTQVTLGKLETSDFRAWMPSSRAQPFRFGRPDRIARRFQGHPSPAFEWDNFDSLNLKKLGDDKFRVEMLYVDKGGKTQKHLFEGSREEIHALINADQDLRPAERAHLLRSLNLRSSDDDSPFPHIWFEPGIGWFFEQPGGTFH